MKTPQQWIEEQFSEEVTLVAGVFWFKRTEREMLALIGKMKAFQEVMAVTDRGISDLYPEIVNKLFGSPNPPPTTKSNPIPDSLQ